MSIASGPSKDALPVGSVALIVLDGWGLAPAGPGNAVSLASTPNFDGMWQSCPHTELSASGKSVGLPDGLMGNSEVGHLNLGAGSIVKQDLVRIDDAIADGSFFENEALRGACAAARECGRLHLMGLASDGGVHSSLDHLRACVELAMREHVPELRLHLFTDGRDTSPTSAPRYVAAIEPWLGAAAEHGTRAWIASVCGRYWAMDRDKRWERIQRAYDMLVRGKGLRAPDAESAVKLAYGRDETDEFIQPTLVGPSASLSEGSGPVGAGDPVLCFNYRPDRMREIVMALGQEDFDAFERPPGMLAALVTMTRYQEDWDYSVAFEPARPAITIAAVLAGRGERQLHVSETEKYPHVTYFFNGGVEHEYDGEERCLVPSPRDVPTYDQKPEMSAHEAAAAFVERWRAAAAGGEPVRFGIINLANPDMVGHTGSIPAATRAVETADVCLGEVVSAVHETGGACIVTADHGNADEMLEPDGSPDTAHSTNPVPLVVTVSGLVLESGGVLADVAPTALALLGIPQPEQMTGHALFALSAP